MPVRVENPSEEQLATVASNLQKQISSRQETIDRLEPERTAIGSSPWRRFVTQRPRFAELNTTLTTVRSDQAEDTEALALLSSHRLRGLRVIELDDQTFQVDATLKNLQSFQADEISFSLGTPPDYTPSKDTQNLVNSAAIRGNTHFGSNVRALRRIAVFFLQAQPAPQPVSA